MEDTNEPTWLSEGSSDPSALQRAMEALAINEVLMARMKLWLPRAKEPSPGSGTIRRCGFH